MATKTPYINLDKPADGEFGWQDMLRSNSDKIDTEAKRINDLVDIEHNTDGTHKSITADTVNIRAGGDLTIGGQSVVAQVSADAAAAQAAATQVAADKAAADADKIAAEAAWSAALASNPDLNPEFRMNPRTIAQDVTIPADFNARSTGPLFIGMSAKVTVAHGGVWRII